jgi:decaprenylphospho-beta-D-ribofuranose 2-oxidase
MPGAASGAQQTTMSEPKASSSDPGESLGGIPTTSQVLTGWGRTAPSGAAVARPQKPQEVEQLLSAAASAGRSVVARGLGRSYGDAAQSAGGVVVDTCGLDSVLDSDLDAGWIRVGAGMSLEALMRSLVPRGWFVPVTPGTRHVSVGGAIAADIHGKNHHRDGSFCSHVSSFTIATPTGVHEATPRSDSELFWATAGGMGLTGIVLEATIKLLPIETAYMLVDTERTTDLDDCLARMTARDDEYRYSVAWIDCMAKGKRLGRAVLTRAEHAKLGELSGSPAGHSSDFDPRVLLEVPMTPPGGLLNPLTVAAFNEMWYRKAPRLRARHPETITSYFHPLDALGSWNRLYGPRGFVQYQFVVPFDAEDALRQVLERLSNARVASFLAVLKRFGEADPGPLSFPTSGWTLALDMPAASPSLARLLDEIDVVVAEAAGRVYLAKDSRLRPELLPTMYPRLAEWQAVRNRVDPDGVLVSDLGRRLGFVGQHASRRQSRPSRQSRARRVAGAQR